MKIQLTSNHDKTKPLANSNNIKLISHRIEVKEKENQMKKIASEKLKINNKNHKILKTFMQNNA